MKLFTCSSCGQALFFDNTRCQRCGHQLAYLPDLNAMSALEPADSGDGAAAQPASEFVALAKGARNGRYRLCANYVQHDVCNWAISSERDSPLCVSCELNVDVPSADATDATVTWARLETAKRRLLYSLLGLGLPLDRRSPANENGLAFSFKSSSATEPVFTGHNDGLITINIAEADDPFREKTRQEMGEPYRTLLGHFRHEIGHYYWDRLIKDRGCFEPFRTIFGDETKDYATEQKRHYEAGPPPDWRERFVSAYASMHPWEDWAETFAHYLHIVDTLETARAYGLALRPRAASGASLPDMTARRLDFDDFDDLITAWFPLTNALNSLNRSMGLSDLYPFVLSQSAIAKLRFVHEIVEKASEDGRSHAKADDVVAKLA
jgi:hypothetical protein